MKLITIITILSAILLIALILMYENNIHYLKSLGYWYANSTYICNLTAQNIQKCYSASQYLCVPISAHGFKCQKNSIYNVYTDPNISNILNISI